MGETRGFTGSGGQEGGLGSGGCGSRPHEDFGMQLYAGSLATLITNIRGFGDG